MPRAILVGANGGIGSAIARRIASSGVELTIAGRNLDGLLRSRPCGAIASIALGGDREPVDVGVVAGVDEHAARLTATTVTAPIHGAR